jgi:hypothetical protein
MAGRIVDRQLVRDIIDDARRNSLRVLQKRAQKTHRAELQRKTQAVVIAATKRDEFPIRIIQMEEPRQLLGGWFTDVAAVADSLVLAQETDGHWIGALKVKKGFAKILTSAALGETRDLLAILFAEVSCKSLMFCNNFCDRNGATL